MENPRKHSHIVGFRRWKYWCSMCNEVFTTQDKTCQVSDMYSSCSFTSYCHCCLLDILDVNIRQPKRGNSYNMLFPLFDIVLAYTLKNTVLSIWLIRLPFSHVALLMDDSPLLCTHLATTYRNGESYHHPKH